jgi:branched-chain amino acid transport system substrate-binding protein
VARVCGRDDQQGLVAADTLRRIKGKNVAILNDKTTYGGLADETKKALNRAGFTEKMFESYNKGADFNAIVSRLKRDNIDLVYVGGYQDQVCWCGRCAIRSQDRVDGRRALGQGVRIDHRPAGEGTLFTFGPDLATNRPPKPSSSVSRPRTSTPGLPQLTPTPRCRSGRGRWRKQNNRSEEGHGDDQGGAWDTVIGRSIRCQGRHQTNRLCRLQMGRQGQLHRDQSEGIVRSVSGSSAVA